MTQTEQALLEHYGIKTLYPSEWPAEKEESESEDEAPPPTKTAAPVRRSKSRYSALERSDTRRSVPGAERTREGVDTLVQKDEPDALGNAPSVVNILRHRGLPVEEDMKLRNRFLLSSTSFNPALFLSEVHDGASPESLLRGLDFLSRSIEQKSASLKVLVENNFERFVRAKATIDNVYKEMRDQGQETPTDHRRHSRHVSKSNLHARNVSGTLTASGLQVNEKRKTALIKESEYGVLGIKEPLLEVALKAEEIWGAALGGRERGENLKSILNSVEKYRGMLELGASIQDCIKRKDYDQLSEEYAKARKYAVDAKRVVESSVQGRDAISDSQIHQVIVTAQMWTDVEEQIIVFRHDVWRQLPGTHFTRQTPSDEERSEEHMALIKILLEVGTEDNPIWAWLLSRYDFLKQKISNTLERSKVELEILRRRLGNGERPSFAQASLHLQSAASPDRSGNTTKFDTPRVIEFWEYEHMSLNAVLSTHGGLLGDVIEFWETAQSFIEGKAQRKLPVGFNGQSKRHHRLSDSNVQELQHGARELITLIRAGISAFFSEPPVEDVSTLFTPVPDSPDTPKTPGSALTPGLNSRFKFDSYPPPSPVKGEFWENYAFWAPYSNSVSGVHYLSKILVLVGTAGSEIAAMSVSRDWQRSVEELKLFVGNVRERCVQAVSAAWSEDAENASLLEDWLRWPDNKYLTHMPFRVHALENAMLASMQKMLYLSEAMTRSGSAEVVVPPSQKLLQTLRSQFVTSIYKVLHGMVENVEHPKKLDTWVEDPDSITHPLRSSAAAKDMSSNAFDASNKNIRTLLTLSNLQELRSKLIPQLITQFEIHFSVKLPEEAAKIDETLSQIYARLFQSYVASISAKIKHIVQSGISSPAWEPSAPRPVDARAYIYDVLLVLVVVHTEVSTTAQALTSQVLKYLLEQTSKHLIEAFRQRSRYTLPALMQATLDVEFLAQTLGNYTTEKASEVQSAIYLALDERTDNDARVKLQGELGELRVVLKKLREATKSEFACFKRQRGHTKGDRPGP